MEYEVLKRFLDIILAITILIILSPLFIVIAVLIKLDDPYGKVFFKQIRVGKDLEEFEMYKFRSMYSDAEDRLATLLKHNEIDGAMFKMQGDPRVTRIGSFIRKYSIDELPQLVNVLTGEMSLIGPRPPLVREVQEYTSYDKKRLNVIPGISGLWQVSGRNSLSFKEMVELDLEYINNLSLMLDITIILKTVVVVIKGTDAY
ncbi:sugar transferase [Alkalibacterium putridalgicola]